ncbi:hypothetical protein ACF1G0_26320 [Streptomyces sp. NPDC013953]|uniref:hypothetical protein n=1 Tax=Streptomyces sp. NPDC013953 TaxID=3364868 RepID=UPI003700126E
MQLAPTHIPYEGLVQEFFGLSDISAIPGFPELADALAHFGVPGGVHTLTLASPRCIVFLTRSFQRRAETVRPVGARTAPPGGRVRRGAAVAAVLRGRVPPLPTRTAAGAPQQWRENGRSCEAGETSAAQAGPGHRWATGSTCVNIDVCRM